MVEVGFSCIASMLSPVGLVSVALLLVGGAGSLPATSFSVANVDYQPLAVSVNGINMYSRFSFPLGTLLQADHPRRVKNLTTLRLLPGLAFISRCLQPFRWGL